MLNILGNQSTKPVKTELSLKEALLSEQIVILSKFYEVSTDVLENVIRTLKKMISVDRQEEIDLAMFYQDLSIIEDSFISVLQEAENGKEAFSNTTVFRKECKSNEVDFYRKVLGNKEEVKNGLNQYILRLERDIQYLENKGFHIYSSNPSPHNILASIKKNTLQLYSTKQRISNEIAKNIIEDNSISTFREISYGKTLEEPDYQVISKNLENIQEKEKVISDILLKKYGKAKIKIENLNKQQVLFLQAQKKCRKLINLLNIEQRIISNKDVSKKQFVSFAMNLYERTDKIALNIEQIYYQKNKRSKSCYPILQSKSRKSKKSNKLIGESQFDENFMDCLERLMGRK